MLKITRGVMLSAYLNMPQTSELFENPEAEELLGKAADLFSENKPEAAETVFGQITQSFPKFFPGWAACGDFYMRVGRPDRALPSLRKAIQLAPFEGMGHYLLGIAYLKAARFNLAERELEISDKLFSGKTDVKAHLGRAKVMLGKIEEGRRLIAKAHEEDPDNPFIRADMAQSYLADKNFIEALRWAESISSENKFFQENTAFIRKLKEDFERLTSEEQKKSRQEFLKPEAENKMRIEMLLALADAGEGIVEDDLVEITEEMRLYGLTGQVTIVKDENDPKSRAVMEFIKMHEELEFGIRSGTEKLSPEKIKKFADILLGEAPLRKKKEAIVLLASSGSKDALAILEDFFRNPRPEELKLWRDAALDECRLINSGVSGKEPPVIFRHLE